MKNLRRSILDNALYWRGKISPKISYQEELVGT